MGDWRWKEGKEGGDLIRIRPSIAMVGRERGSPSPPGETDGRREQRPFKCVARSLRRKALCLSLSVSAFLPSRCPIKTCSYKAPFLTLSFAPSSQGAAPYLSGGFVAIIRCMQCPRVDKILHEKQRDDPGPASKKQPA